MLINKKYAGYLLQKNILKKIGQKAKDESTFLQEVVGVDIFLHLKPLYMNIANQTI